LRRFSERFVATDRFSETGRFVARFFETGNRDWIGDE
jgi:hypothetical protein